MSLDTMHRLAKAYPGGIEVLAERLGKRVKTFRAELLPPVGSTAKLGWLDAISIMEMSRQVGAPLALTPLDMVEADFGRMAIELPSAEVGDDLMCKVALASEEFAKLMAEVASDAGGGQVSDNALKRIRGASQSLFADVQALLRVVAEMNVAGKPALARVGAAA